jgi:hypothetical protein
VTNGGAREFLIFATEVRHYRALHRCAVIKKQSPRNVVYRLQIRSPGWNSDHLKAVFCLYTEYAARVIACKSEVIAD